MVPGPKPKPAAIRKLMSRSHHSQNKDAPTPHRPARVPPAPKWMGLGARAEWKLLARQLHELGVLTNIDLDALARYCVIYERWRLAEKTVKKMGVITKTPNGYLAQNAWLAVANKSQSQLQTLAAEFGLTPSSRVRVKTMPLSEDQSQQLENELFGKPVKVVRKGRG